MAGTLTIQYDVDPVTGERRILVHYESEDDALPMEHEEEHRALVDKLVEGGVIAAAEAGRVVVVREEPADRHGDERTERPEQARRAVEERD